jgi:hypothetical protein
MIISPQARKQRMHEKRLTVAARPLAPIRPGVEKLVRY